MSKTNDDRLNGLYQSLLADLSTENTFASIRLKERARKRMRFSNDLSSESLDNFKKFNDFIGKVDLSNLNIDLINEARYFIERKMENYMTSLDANNIQIPFSQDRLYDNWRFGPGASYEVSGTHCAEKISQPMTCTQNAESLVVNLRKTNPYFHSFDSSNKKLGITVHRGSKLTTVPKNEDTMRVIAIEPSGNMCLQLSVGAFLEGVLRSIGLDIRNQQTKNRLLAKRGSIDGSLMTIDLKNASDSFKPELVQALVPASLYETLMNIRSPETYINGEWVKLNMISTMGNGFTFPLMTLILCSLIYAYRRLYRNGPNLKIDWSTAAVFGDDIIIETDEYPFLEVLGQCGLIVNFDKSYSEGPFRESCGGDYFEGQDVTPFYVKNLLQNSDIYVAINQVMEWSVKHKMLWHSLTYLKELLHGEPFFVPEWSNPDQGIRTLMVKRRYKYLQPVIAKRKISDDHHFLMMLAVGGYINAEGPDYFYNPRQYKTRYVVRRGRLPQGYLSGFDPEKGSYPTRARLATFLSLSFSSGC